MGLDDVHADHRRGHRRHGQTRQPAIGAGRAQPAKALISLSADGEFIAKAVARQGFPAVRGSSANKNKTEMAKGGTRLAIVTDAAVNVRPNLQRKLEIVHNAVGIARALGIARPRVAMLAATEKVLLPAMPATLDAQIVSRMAEQGEFGEADVAGPMALDIAISPDAATRKSVSNPVAGRAGYRMLGGCRCPPRCLTRTHAAPSG